MGELSRGSATGLLAGDAESSPRGTNLRSFLPRLHEIRLRVYREQPSSESENERRHEDFGIPSEVDSGPEILLFHSNPKLLEGEVPFACRNVMHALTVAPNGRKH